MWDVGRPFPIKGLDLKPEPKAAFKLEENIIQALASLLGWDGEARRLLTCSISGSLNTISPRVKAIINEQAGGSHVVFTYTDSPTSEVLIYADENNASTVWVNIDAVPSIGTGYPLYSGDFVKLSINNLQSLQLLVLDQNDNVCIVQTV